jgi:hypothetical protein
LESRVADAQSAVIPAAMQEAKTAKHTIKNKTSIHLSVSKVL